MFRIFGKPENKLRVLWRATLADHTIGLAWSPDGQWVAAAAVSGPITVFAAATGTTRCQLSGHGFGTAAIAWQPGGGLLASVGQDGRVRLWDPTAGVEVRSLEAGAAWAEKVVWHPSGQRVATAAGKKARVWTPDGQLVRELPPQSGTVTDLAWRPGTSHLTVLAYGGATIYDPDAGAEPVKALAWKGSPLALAWSPDGQMLAHGNQDATVHFWYYDSGRDLQMWGYRTKVRELSWDCTSRYLATGGGPAVCVWDTRASERGPEGTQPQILAAHDRNSTVTAVAYQARGHLLASAATDGQVVLWQPVARRKQLGTYKFPSGEASVLAWSPDDHLLAAGSGAGDVVVLQAD